MERARSLCKNAAIGLRRSDGVNQMKKLAIPARAVGAAALCAMLAGPAPDRALAQPQQDFRGQKIVHLLQEPRHRTVFRDGDVYLLDVQLNPGDVSFPHLHDAPLMTTSISTADGPGNGRVGVNIDYAERNYTHAISNAGPGLLRILALTSYHAGVAGDGDAPAGMTAEPDVENRWFRSYRLSLGPGEETPLQTHQQPTFVILVTPGEAHVTRADGITAELRAAGAWTYRAPGASFLIRNTGAAALELVVNEARR